MIVSAHEVGQSIKDLSADIAKQTGKKKKEVYNYALKILQNIREDYLLENLLKQ